MRFGVLAPVTRRFGQALERAQLADQAGCDSIWVPQQEDARDALVTLAAYAAATSRVGLGTAVLPIHAVHPAALMQAAATLDELAGGRFRLGLGVGHRSIVGGMWGIQPGQPLDVMREYVAIVGRGLREGRVDHQGSRYEVHWQYDGPRRPSLPILLAGLRPKMLELAGEIADGVIVWLATPEYVRDTVLPAVLRGRQRRGAGLDGFEVAVIIHVCASSDIEAAREITSRMLQPALRFSSYQALLERQGLRWNQDNLDTESLDRLTALGEAALIRSRLDRYLQAGCTLPLLVPCPDHPGAAGIDAMLLAMEGDRG